MNNFYKACILLSLSSLASCVAQNQSQGYAQQISPPKVTQPCEKIEALIKEYDNSFERIKLKSLNNRISKIWQAKYHLVGNSCQVWAWGTNSTTYACSLTAPNKETAQNYFDKAKNVTQGCLADSWSMNEQARKNNDGMKVEFTNKDSDIAIAAHMVPTAGLFKSEWTVYYYVGSDRHPK